MRTNWFQSSAICASIALACGCLLTIVPAARAQSGSSYHRADHALAPQMPRALAPPQAQPKGNAALRAIKSWLPKGHSQSHRSGSTSRAAAAHNEPKEGSDADSLVSFARLSERRGELKDAKRIYTAVLNKQPNHKVALHRLGIVAAKSGDFREAEELLFHVSQLGKPTAELLNDIGYVRYLQSDHKTAEAFYQQALDISPHHEATLNNLAILYGDSGRLEESLNMFRRVGTDAEAHANLAYVFTQRGELDRAYEYYNRALTLDKTLKSAARALLQLEKRRKEVELLAQSAFPEDGESNGKATVADRRAKELPTVVAADNAGPSRVQAASSVQTGLRLEDDIPVVDLSSPALNNNTDEPPRFVPADHQAPVISLEEAERLKLRQRSASRDRNTETSSRLRPLQERPQLQPIHGPATRSASKTSGSSVRIHRQSRPASKPNASQAEASAQNRSEARKVPVVSEEEALQERSVLKPASATSDESYSVPHWAIQPGDVHRSVTPTGISRRSWRDNLKK